MEGGDLTEHGSVHDFDDDLSIEDDDGFAYGRICGCSRKFDNLREGVFRCGQCGGIPDTWDNDEDVPKNDDAVAVTSVKEWMLFLLGAAKAMTAEGRAIVLGNEESSASMLDEHDYFSARDSLASPALYSALSFFSWMVPSNELYLCSRDDLSSDRFICVALSPFIALELRTSRLFTIPKKHNAQLLDIIIVGAECEQVGRLKLLVDGKLDKLVFTAPGSLDIQLIVLPPAVMLRNYLPRLGNDVVQAILDFVGSPFLCDPPITVETLHPLRLNYCTGYTSGNATYTVKYSKSSLGAQSLIVESDFSSCSDYDAFGYVHQHKSTWRGDGRDAMVVKVNLSSYDEIFRS